MKKPAFSYFYFTKKERTGIFTILVIVTLLMSGSYLIRSFKSEKIVTNNYALELAGLKKVQADSAKKNFTYEKREYNYTPYTSAKVANKGELFYFDPNSLSHEGWKRLGLRDNTIGIINNYLSKGGRFRKADDIKNIWGLEEHLAQRLIPFVRIPESADSTPQSGFVKTYPGKKEYHAVDINLADTNSLSQLPGIGIKLSRRIINYRERLGGFYSADQVAETFGLADSIFKKIRPSLQVSEAGVKKININLATLDELKAHPYIRYHLANAIVQYRQQHGDYKQIEDLKHIMLINDSIYNKVSGYLSLE